MELPCLSHNDRNLAGKNADCRLVAQVSNLLTCAAWEAAQGIAGAQRRQGPRGQARGRERANRRLPAGRRWEAGTLLEPSTTSGLEIRDPADWKSALRTAHRANRTVVAQVSNLPCRRLPAGRGLARWGRLRLTGFVLGLLLALLPSARAVTNVFFSPTQTTNLVATNVNSDTIETAGYFFTLSRDKLFTGGVGLTNPIGRSLRIQWPDGLEAQAPTVGPNTGTGARITLTRADGHPFDIRRFTFRILGNTAGAGAMLEIMPLVNGEDALPDPLMYQATGFYGQTFTNVTPELSNYDTYKLKLYMDFALMNLTAVDPSPPPPTLAIQPEPTGFVTLSWTPTTGTKWILQERLNLTSGTWANAPSGWTNPVIIPTTLRANFYRLFNASTRTLEKRAGRESLGYEDGP